jgi:TolA-binding protein
VLGCALAILAFVFVRQTSAQGDARGESKDRAVAAASGDLAAQRLLDKAQELLDSGERDRGVKMIETVLEQYPASRIVYPACLALGKHYLQANQQLDAINYLSRLKVLETAEGGLKADDRDLFLEATYLTGVAHFQTRQYGKAFPILRHITSKYPNTVWANQAYYYIGMCHFAQQNWNQAIEALSLVGTFVDPQSPTTMYAEAGRRFYVKVEDPDFPVMLAMGKKISVKLTTGSGDREEIPCVSLTADSLILIGSIPTDIGVAKPGDGVLQVTGGEEVTTTYVDESTESGAANVVRSSKVRIVSTGTVDFMLGDFETRAVAAFLGQPMFIRLFDADLDTSERAESMTVTVISRYKYKAEDEDEDQSAFADQSKMRYQTRDRVEVRLTEQVALPVQTGGAPGQTNAPAVAVPAAVAVRSGRFTGKVEVVAAQEGRPADQSDAVLSCMMNDEVLVSCTDGLHIGGEAPRVVEAMVLVVGEVDNRPRATQDVVFDPVLRASKNLVEATAYLELARIFRSMGLLAGARERAMEGIGRVDTVIRASSSESSFSLKQQEAFKLKWELHIEAGQLPEALATCGLFSQIFPKSPLVAQALMGMGNIRVENKEYDEAISIFRQITALRESDAKAEAQFRIAQTIEMIPPPPGASKSALDGQKSRAIQEYKMCADRYPSTSYAGESLAKIIDYTISKGDFAQANSLLEQTFQDYPDASFLDSMLMKWVLVAYQSGDFAKAKEKCTKLLFEYPESSHAPTARELLPRIEAQLK